MRSIQSVMGAMILVLAPFVAATAHPLTQQQANSAVQQASHKLAKVLRTFKGPGGLTGAVIEGPDGTRNIAWVTADGKAVVIHGELVGLQGQDYTQGAMYDERLLLSPAVALEAAASPSTHSILIGSNPKAPIVTAFFDPNCIFCHLLYKAIDPYVTAGKVRVRFVLVGVIKPDSLARATSMLMARDPAKALAVDETKFNRAHEEGGYPIDGLLDPALTNAVKANGNLMAKADGHGTPTLLYCSASAKSVQLASGLPPDMARFVADVASGSSAACR
ncbi:thiol:disulfide interchange protein DsbG [Metallibacterium scheffleri]|uniref:Thiol:disulfide interchange protein DsbG n=1 Tax=Metallibacterium scheffleri TaxID=993689 RepID=A0A4S3KQK6_9GAMM|nr:thiol:disulfide interchange protein DsbG [Metallibacterium scheffleri]THD11335.1 thiol:disulfide interchange protein DsbG [Metallibacterium scheffleri]